MNATINLAEKDRFLSLLHAMFAIHDRFTHDENAIAFRRDDGFTLHINFSVNHVWFGPEGGPQKERFWTENISIGKMDALLALFIHNQDDELRRFRWLIRPANHRKRKRP